MNTSKWFLFVFLLLIALAPDVFSHANGTSKIDVFLFPEKIETLVDVNKNDILNIISPQGFEHLSTEERIKHQSNFLLYLQSRLNIVVDGERLDQVKVMTWLTEDGVNYKETDTLVYNDGSNYIVRLSWPIKAQSKSLQFSVQMFPEFGTSCIANTTIFWQGKVIQQNYLTPSTDLWVSIEPKELEKRINAIATGTQSKSKQKSTFFQFLHFGFIHILPLGIDHILFVLGLFFFSIKFKPILGQITAFTIAHSITLGLSLFDVFSLPSSLVEPLIAFSITFVAAENIFGSSQGGSPVSRNMKPWRWMIVFGFGLLHGLGFASALKDLGIPDGTYFTALLSFNIGVELGQLTVVSAIALLTVSFWKKTWYFRFVVIPFSALIGTVGLYWTIERTFF